MKNGERTMVQVGWNETSREYDLIPIGPRGELVTSLAEEMFPPFIVARGSGTVVTFLGNDEGDATFHPPNRPRGWLFKYLNQRFFRFSDDDVEMLVRVPSGNPEEWPLTREDASDRRREDADARPFRLQRVKGTASVWDAAADRVPGNRGVAPVPGDPAASVPPANIHWWVLPSGPGTDVSTRTSSGGSVAVLYQNELHDWRTGSQANPFFARMGVLFGKTRVAFLVEPLGNGVTADFARAHVLVNRIPTFESDAWLVWSDQFRRDIPEAIKVVLVDEQARLQQEDPDRARRIRERLKDVMQLLRPRRFKPTPDGVVRAGGMPVTGSGGGAGGAGLERVVGASRRAKGTSVKGIGAVLTQLDDTDGEPSNEVLSILRLEPRWVTEHESDDMPIVNGDNKGLHDRAAALAGEDGITAQILLLNREFRGYQAILAAINEWVNPEGDDQKAQVVESVTQEWIEQKMVEAVNGLRQLENGSSWTGRHFDDALSPVALTAAFMADRYHTLREVKRQVGNLRTAVS